jgi:hypothetical protein
MSQPDPPQEPDDGIPFLITAAMKARLRAAGYSDVMIANMTPLQAKDILNGPKKFDPDAYQRGVDEYVESMKPKPKDNGQNDEAPRQFDSDPVDLWGNFEPPILPRGILPKLIENYAFTQAETMGVDPGGVAMAALVVCAAAITDSITLVMKRHSSEWTESARLWVGLVGLQARKRRRSSAQRSNR